MMRTGLAIAALAATAGVLDAKAQPLTLEALSGYSIVSRHEEILDFPNGRSVRQVWNDRVYFSTKGRIFHKFNLDSDHAASGRALEMIGGEQGKLGTFRWGGDGITRQWRNPRGGVGHQSFHITGRGGIYACRLSLERVGMMLTARPISQRCTVVKGNALEAG